MAQEPRWVQTHCWSGVGSCQTQLFWANGSKWRIVYEPQGKKLFTIRLFNRAGELLHRVANPVFPHSGSAAVSGKGEYFLEITALDETRWTVSIEQYLSVIEEWQLLQIMRQPQPQFSKLGTWTGEAVEAQHTLTVPQPRWKLVYAHSGVGTLRFVVRDERGEEVAAGCADQQTQKGVCWVHRSGKFVMDLKAVDTSWKVDVFAEEEVASP
jgi:hypothetical protein